MDEYSDKLANIFLEEDAVYNYYATPLKSANVIKKQHLSEIQNFLELKELQIELDKASQLIFEYLPPHIKEEVTHAAENFTNNFNSSGESDSPTFLKDMCEFSDEMLLHIYQFAAELMAENKNADAYALFVFLTTVAPYVPSYWIAEALCLQRLDRHKEALAILSAIQTLDETNPALFAYAIDSCLILKEKEKSVQYLLKFKEIMKNFDGHDKEFWQNKLEYFLNINI